jgi:hypothetical protein
MSEIAYSDVIVQKPWGCEYLCYQNKELAIWILKINFGQKTSFHCHPNKNTGFVVLEGLVELSFMRHKRTMSSLDKIHIFKGRFDSTQAVSKWGAWVMEIETPEDKQDLVRLEDEYGRENLPYESKKYEIPKNDECLWIAEPGPYNSSEHKFKDCLINHFSPVEKSQLYGHPELDSFIVTRGGIMANNSKQIIFPGDILDGISLERLLKSFDLIQHTTIIKISK